MNSFLPTGYEVPKTAGNYLKFEKGATQFRVLSVKPIIGYEYWTTDNKPQRSAKKPETAPLDIKLRDDKTWQDSITHFWAFAVWDYGDSAVKILEITQKSVQGKLAPIFQDPDYGHPNGYDIVVTRTGEDMLTRYEVMPKPPKPVAPEIAEAFAAKPVNLDALFVGGDPFAPTQQAADEAW